MTQAQKLIALAGLCVALVLTWPGAVPLGLTDPLTTAVTSAYADETGADKAGEAAALANVYAKGQKLSADMSIVKAVDLFKELKGYANASLSPDALPKVRAVIAVELNANLPVKADATFNRAEAAKQFKRCQTALEACK